VIVAECEREPLVPVTDTCLFPVELNVHDRVEVPDAVTLLGVRVQEEVVLVARLTTPANPFTELIVIVEVLTEFTLTLTLVGLAAIVKSSTTMASVTV
jgi:hypothetical protein